MHSIYPSTPCIPHSPIQLCPKRVVKLTSQLLCHFGLCDAYLVPNIFYSVSRQISSSRMGVGGDTFNDMKIRVIIRRLLRGA